MFKTIPETDAELESFNMMAYSARTAHEVIEEQSRRTIPAHLNIIREQLAILSENYDRCMGPADWTTGGVQHYTILQYNRAAYALFTLDIATSMVNNEEFDPELNRWASQPVSAEEAEAALAMMEHLTGDDFIIEARKVRAYVGGIHHAWNNGIPQEFLDNQAQADVSMIYSMFMGIFEQKAVQNPYAYPEIYP